MDKYAQSLEALQDAVDAKEICDITADIIHIFALTNLLLKNGIITQDEIGQQLFDTLADARDALKS